MVVGRALGWLFLVAALAAAAVEVFRALRDGLWEVFALGEAWASVDANSLVGFGAFVEKSISPALWSGVFVPALSAPLWLYCAILGALFLYLFRDRPKRRFRRG